VDIFMANLTADDCFYGCLRLIMFLSGPLYFYSDSSPSSRHAMAASVRFLTPSVLNMAAM